MTTETAGKIVGSSKTFPIDNIIFFRSTFDRNPRPYPNVLEANQRRPPSGRSGANHRPTPMNRRRNELHPVTPSRFFLLATLRIEGITPIHLHPTRVKNASTRHQASNGTFKKEPSGVPEGRKPIAILFFSWGGASLKQEKHQHDRHGGSRDTEFSRKLRRRSVRLAVANAKRSSSTARTMRPPSGSFR